MQGFSGNGLLLMLRHSDAMTIFVLFVLLSMSIISWAIFLYKIVVWRVKNKQIQKALLRMKSAENLDVVLQLTSDLSQTLPGYVLSRCLGYLKSLLTPFGRPQKNVIDQHDFEMLDYMVGQTVNTTILNEESWIPYLSVAAASGPLIGLFGTVWGLINAFLDISNRQSADISAVAPGIAQALIGAMAGLMVAIPALLMYHYLMLRLRAMENQIVLLTDRFMWLAQNIFTIKVEEK
jgi:biopolymer transport protein TolQ